MIAVTGVRRFSSLDLGPSRMAGSFAARVVNGPSDQPFVRRTVQFSRVITPLEDIQVWNATSDGFSFVISFASRSGPGFRGNPGLHSLLASDPSKHDRG